MTAIDPRTFTEAQKQKWLRDRAAAKEKIKYNQLAAYRPRAWQVPFHEDPHRFRMYMAPNRIGKTYAGAMEFAMHVTGRYPDWWKGFRFEKPIDCWVIGTSYAQMRDACQALLLGVEYGTGAIPKDAIDNVFTQPGSPGAAGIVRVKHVSGGISNVTFKAYNQGRVALQGAALDLAWMDEEPLVTEQEAGIVEEIKTRLRDRQGKLMITYTPLEGETRLTKEFFPDPKYPDQYSCIHIDMADYPELAADIEKVKKDYPAPHQWRARIHGLPALGEGAVFPFTEDHYVVPVTRLPPHTRYLYAMDYGTDHPTAVVLLGWVEDEDTTYVVQEFREKDCPAAIVASWVRRFIPGAKVAWPHDMGQRTGPGSGVTKMETYKAEGMSMCGEHAQYPDDRKNNLEASISDIRERIADGRFKVFDNCQKLIGEMGKYNRKKGKPVAIDDDLISAARYAHMMLRYSRTAERIGKHSVRGHVQIAEGLDADPWDPYRESYAKYAEIDGQKFRILGETN